MGIHSRTLKPTSGFTHRALASLEGSSVFFIQLLPTLFYSICFGFQGYNWGARCRISSSFSSIWWEPQPREWLHYSASQWVREDSLMISSYHLGTGFQGWGSLRTTHCLWGLSVPGSEPPQTQHNKGRSWVLPGRDFKSRVDGEGNSYTPSPHDMSGPVQSSHAHPRSFTVHNSSTS